MPDRFWLRFLQRSKKNREPKSLVSNGFSLLYFIECAFSFVMLNLDGKPLGSGKFEFGNVKASVILALFGFLPRQ